MSKIHLASFQCNPDNRSKEDIDKINAYLSKINELLHCNTEELTCCSKIVKIQTFKKNDLLYKKFDRIHCWYYIISGSVLIGSVMFVANKSFGERDEGKCERGHDCLVLEESTLLLFPYDICCHWKKYPCSCLKKRLTDNYNSSTLNRKANHKSPHSSDASSGYSGSDHVSTGGGDSESISVHIGSDFNSNSIRQSIGSSSQRTEGLGNLDSDSDDEISDIPSTEISYHDHIKDILMKDPNLRTNHETDAIMHIIHNISIFSLWPESLKRVACRLARLSVIEKAQTVLIQKGERLAYWGYCLQGTLEVRKSIMDTSSISSGIDLDSSNLGEVLETLRYSDNFGADLRNSEPQISKYYLVTAVDDCWVMTIEMDMFNEAKSHEPDTVSNVQENKKVVVVMERRNIDSDNGSQGNVLVKATSKKLVEYLFENHSAAEESYVEDFFLTYNIHLNSTHMVRKTIIDMISRQPKQRHRCTDVVVKWISNHFREIESQQPEVLKFIDLIVLMLLRENEDVCAGQIYQACSKNSQPRTVTVTLKTDRQQQHHQQQQRRNGPTSQQNQRQTSSLNIAGNGSRVLSRDKVVAQKENYPVEFSRLPQFRGGINLVGLYLRPNSAEHTHHSAGFSQLRVGDRILQLNSTSEEYLSSHSANSIVTNSQLCTFTVKYDPEGFYLPFLTVFHKKCNSNSNNHSFISQKHSPRSMNQINRSASIHNGLFDLDNQDTDDNSLGSPAGYCTLPLKPTLISMTTTHHSGNATVQKRGSGQNNQLVMRKAIQTGGGGNNNSSNCSAGNVAATNANQSALKKMMKRYKTNTSNYNSYNNNNSSMYNDDINSTSTPGSSSNVTTLDGKQINVNKKNDKSKMNKCRSAHNSPCRTGSGGIVKGRSESDGRGIVGCGDGGLRYGGNKTASSGELLLQTTGGTDNGSVFSPSVRSTSGESLVTAQPVKIQKLRNRSDSQPDLRKMANNTVGSNLHLDQEIKESVIKVHYKEATVVGGSNTKAVYLFVTKETESLEIILKCINELNLACNTSLDFVLVEVTVEPGTMLKQRTIKNTQSNLAAMLKLNSRLYLRRRDFSGQLLDNNDIDEIESEMNQSILSLSVSELAVQIFVETYNAFRAISPSEIVDFVTNKSRAEPIAAVASSSSSSPDSPMLPLMSTTTTTSGSSTSSAASNNFSHYMRLGDKYMYLVVSAVCGEYSSANRRCKVLKRIIKLARLCKEMGNIEVFFSLINGLDRTEVNRLKQTWDKLPSKHMSMYRQMQSLLDVSGNMRLLRSLHRSSIPPVISMAALITKDLTTVHEVHPTKVSMESSSSSTNGLSSSSGGTGKKDEEMLVNFDKFRIMSRLVRRFTNSIYRCNDTSEVFHRNECYLLPDEEISQVEMLRDTVAKLEHKDLSKSISKSQTNLNKRLSMNINPKKMYEKELERLRTKHFLMRFDNVEKDDAVLLSLSYKCEPKSEMSGGMTPSISRNTMITSVYDRENSVSYRHSTTGSLSSKDSIILSSGSDQYMETNFLSGSHRLPDRTLTSTRQLQYLEPGSRRHITHQPPPYSSLQTVGGSCATTPTTNTASSSPNPPIPPRRRSSTTPNERSHHNVGCSEKPRSYSNILAKDEEATHL